MINSCNPSNKEDNICCSVSQHSLCSNRGRYRLDVRKLKPFATLTIQLASCQLTRCLVECNQEKPWLILVQIPTRQFFQLGLHYKRDETVFVFQLLYKDLLGPTGLTQLSHSRLMKIVLMNHSSMISLIIIIVFYLTLALTTTGSQCI